LAPSAPGFGPPPGSEDSQRGSDSCGPASWCRCCWCCRSRRSEPPCRFRGINLSDHRISGCFVSALVAQVDLINVAITTSESAGFRWPMTPASAHGSGLARRGSPRRRIAHERRKTMSGRTTPSRKRCGGQRRVFDPDAWAGRGPHRNNRRWLVERPGRCGANTSLTAASFRRPRRSEPHRFVAPPMRSDGLSFAAAAEIGSPST
jgi:hypothetical protein